MRCFLASAASIRVCCSISQSSAAYASRSATSMRPTDSGRLGGCRRRRQGAVEGELRPRCDDPLNDHRLNQIAHALVDASAALQRSFEPELADHGLHRSHMAVRQTANNLEAGLRCAFTRDLQPSSSAAMPAISACGSFDKFASVRFLKRPPSR